MSDSTADVWDTLADAGLLPRDHGPPPPAPPDMPSDDLLPLLISAWEQARDSAKTTTGNRLPHWPEKLAPWHARGARLTQNVPGAPFESANRWLGRRLAWWPRGVPNGQRVGLVSSRIGRAPDTQQAWFTMLRAACGKIDADRDLLVTSESTTTDRYVDRAAALFGLRVLRIDVPQNDEQSPVEWFARVLAGGETEANDHGHTVFLSPPLPGLPEETDKKIDSVPVRDRALVALSDRLLAFRVRRKGNLHRLVEARLGDPAWPPASVYVGLGPRLVRTEMAAELMDAGAVGWVVLESAAGEPGASHGESPVDSSAESGDSSCRGRLRRAALVGLQHETPAAVVSFPSSEDWSFLTHCTRRRAGPWPDQEEPEFLDDLILARDEADHSALSAMKRILRQQRLIATARTIRGATPVVSFTAVPLAELHRLRVFRPHRGRWDFEPYGICISRDWLQQQGAHAVHYGDDQLWESLPSADRPFFQLRRTRRVAGTAAIDWTVEDEWRVVGDVDLTGISDDGAMLFVPSQAEAQEIAQVSRWPATAVPAAEK
jgi:hypothetical protein